MTDHSSDVKGASGILEVQQGPPLTGGQWALMVSRPYVNQYKDLLRRPKCRAHGIRVHVPRIYKEVVSCSMHARPRTQNCGAICSMACLNLSHECAAMVFMGD